MYRFECKSAYLTHEKQDRFTLVSGTYTTKHGLRRKLNVGQNFDTFDEALVDAKRYIDTWDRLTCFRKRKEWKSMSA